VSTTQERVTLRVVVYSDDSGTREQVIRALGERLHPELPDLEYVEVATAPMLLSHLDSGTVDVAILDGEASPAGGMGMAKQIRDEYSPCPPLVVLVAREADQWLADWSRADAAARVPVDPMELSRTVVALLR
jgi:DNA-binding NarL/FixJ family response regulator